MKHVVLSPSAQGHLLALGATVIWSSLYIFARVLAERFTPAELAFWRWAVAFAALYPFVAMRMRASFPAARTHLCRLLIFSLIGMTGFSLMIFLAGRTASATNMSLIAATAPVFIALISRFILKERLGLQQTLGLGIAVCGVVVLVTRGDFWHLTRLDVTTGDLWMLLGAACFGTYCVLVRFRPADLPPLDFLTWLMGLGALWLLPVVVWQWLEVRPPFLPRPEECLSLLHIGLVTSVLAFIWWNKAIARIGAVRCGIVYYSLPFFSALLAVIFLGESLTLSQIVGGLLIVGGIVFSSLSTLRTT